MAPVKKTSRPRMPKTHPKLSGRLLANPAMQITIPPTTDNQAPAIIQRRRMICARHKPTWISALLRTISPTMMYTQTLINMSKYSQGECQYKLRRSQASAGSLVLTQMNGNWASLLMTSSLPSLQTPCPGRPSKPTVPGIGSPQYRHLTAAALTVSPHIGQVLVSAACLAAPCSGSSSSVSNQTSDGLTN